MTDKEVLTWFNDALQNNHGELSMQDVEKFWQIAKGRGVNAFYRDGMNYLASLVIDLGGNLGLEIYAYLDNEHETSALLQFKFVSTGIIDA